MKRWPPTPRIVIAVTVAIHLATAVYFSAVTPLGDTPDEYAHFEYVQYLLKHRAFPKLEPDFYETRVHEAHQPPAYYVVGALLVAPLPELPRLRLQNNSFFKWDTPIPAYLPLPEHSFPWRGAVLRWHALRFLSIGFGLVSLLFVYLTAREFFGRGADWAAAACVAFVGLNPQVIFIQTAVSNDCLTILAGAALTYAAVRLARRPELASFAVAALAVAFAALAKVNAVLLLPMLVPACLFALMRLPNARKRAAAVGLMILVPCAAAGWWYWRSVQTYGDLSGINMMRRTFEYGSPLTPREWFTQLPDAFWWTFVTAWGGFGWERIMLPSPVAAVVLAVCLVPLAGVAIRLIEVRWRSGNPAPRVVAIGFLLGLGALTVGFLMYHRLLGASSAWSGRRFFPALTIFALAWVFGWRCWMPGVDRRLALGTLTGGAALVLFSVFLIVRPLYAPPPVMPEGFQPTHPAAIRYGQILEFLGYDWPAESGANPTLYWRLAGEPEDHFHAILELDDNTTSPTRMISPLEPRRPISSWPLQVIIAAPYDSMPDWAASATLRVERGFYTLTEVSPTDSATSRPLAPPVLARDRTE